jgi:hypothetical protein
MIAGLGALNNGNGSGRSSVVVPFVSHHLLGTEAEGGSRGEHDRDGGGE